MAKATQEELDRIPLSKRGKLFKWYKFYTDESNPATFLDKTESARAAKYKANSNISFSVIGYQNFNKLQSRLTKWFDQVGLSDNRLQAKLVALLDAKETKFFQHEGIVTDQRDVEALETQRRTLDMAIKVRGMYAPAQLTGAGGRPLALDFLEVLQTLGSQLKMELETRQAPKALETEHDTDDIVEV